MDRAEQFWVLAASAPQELGDFIVKTWCRPHLGSCNRIEQFVGSAQSDLNELQGLYRWLKDLAYYAGGGYATSLANADEALLRFANSGEAAKRFVLSATGWADLERRAPMHVGR